MSFQKFIFEQLRCPICKVPLSFFGKKESGGTFYCNKCKASYPYFDGISKIIPHRRYPRKEISRMISIYDEYSKMHDIIYSNPYISFMRSIERLIIGTYVRESSGIVLDIGCGTGIYAIYLAKRGFNVVCIDLSRKMLETAREKARRLHLENKIVFIQADGAWLPFNEKIFDHVLAIFGAFNHTRYYRRGMRTVSKILKKNGYFIFSVLNKWRIQYVTFLIKKMKIKRLVISFKKPNGYISLPVSLRKRRIYCHFFSPKELLDLLKPNFNVILMGGIFLLFYPKFQEKTKMSRFHKFLVNFEKRLFLIPPFNKLGYYTIVVAKNK